MKVYNEQPTSSINEDLLNILNKIRKDRDFDAKKYINKKAEILNKYMSKFGLKGCVVAISGGIDSAIVLGLIKYASTLPNSPIKTIKPLLLPIFKSTGVTGQVEATNRGKELCDSLDIPCNIIDLSIINNQIRNELESTLGIKGDNWAIGQLGPYSRTPMLYYTTSLLSQEGFPSIVCGTTNRDEGAYLGYVGKASDGMVDIQLISDIHKSEVYKVAKELKIPKSIIEVIPTGDMYDNRVDESVFGAPYDFVEIYLNYLNKSQNEKDEILNNLSKESLEQFNFYAKNLENMHNYNKHKYMSKSPAIHLDLWDSSVVGGWDNYNKITMNILEN